MILDPDLKMYTWITLSASSDLKQLEKNLDPEFGPKRVVETLTIGLSNSIRHILVERNYVDKDYRSTYYNFYAKKGQAYRQDCIRLHFFDATVTFSPDALRLTCPDGRLDDHYFGYMVLRPTGIATIGRSVVSPDVRNGVRGQIITAKHKVHLLGYKLAVEGFPSMDQHIDIAVCAHAACWSMLRHYSERYANYREFLTHDITLMAHPFNPGGLIPSKGLDLSHAERVLQAAGTFPIIVPRKNANDIGFYRQLHAYVESGFPLFAAMHRSCHAVAVVGYEWHSASPKKTGRLKAQSGGLRYAWDEVKSLVVVDDNALPYLSVPIKGRVKYSVQHIDAFIVALPEKVFYPADAVERVARLLFKFAPLVSLPREDQSIIRYFMTTGSALRRFMRERASEFDARLVQAVMTQPFSQFVWIIELATQADWSCGQISARAVVDATASLREPVPFWLIHNRMNALIFDRNKVAAGSAGLRRLPLSGMQTTALTRWDQNLRPIICK